MGRYCIKVDMQLCQGHGECAEEAPQVFEVDYDTAAYPKVRVLQAQACDGLRSGVEAAAKYCPNKVITLVVMDE
jgi:ferredoxin